MIFYTLIAFIVAVVLQILMFYFLPPIGNDQKINYFNALVFSINAGILLASLYSLILFFIYWLMKAYNEIIYKTFFRRAVLFGIVISTSLFLRIIDALDWIILIGLVITVICLELILARKE